MRAFLSSRRGASPRRSRAAISARTETGTLAGTARLTSPHSDSFSGISTLTPNTVASAALDLAKQDLGADEVVDDRATDLLRQGRRFDVVYDVAAALDGRSASAHPLARAGLYLTTGGTIAAAIATRVGRGTVS